MKTAAAICVLVLAFSAGLQATEREKVAIIEFQNKAGTIITTNRWTMADDLGKRLKKKNRAVQTISSKELRKQLKQLSWNEDRLDSSQEAKVADLGAKYVVYGRIVNWHVYGAYSNTEVQDASEGLVTLLLDVIDLSSGKSIKSFTVDGASTGETGMIVDQDPASFNNPDEEDQMYAATEVALIKAADILAQTLTE